MKKIAVIDNDPYIGDMLERLLRQEGYQVSRAYSGTEALLLLARERPDLILLDLMLPGLSGEEILPKIREIPVIAVSAKAGTGDKVAVLQSGAMDYITKPFDTKELLARIAVQLRNRKDHKEAELYTYGALRLDPAARAASVGNTPLRLTGTEYAILKQLMKNAPQVVPKSQLLELISLDTPDCTESSLKVHVSNLRRKLRDACAGDFIEAVWGIGFKMRDL